MSLLEYYTQRLIELVTEQRKLYPFAFNLMDAPSDKHQEESFFLYWEKEQSIQNCKDELLKLKGLA